MNAGFHDITSEMYHRDPCDEPSLSSGIARTIVIHSPAHAFLEHPRLGKRKTEPTADMILGAYVHGILGHCLSEFEIGLFNDYKSKAAQEWREGVFYGHKTPILEKTAQHAHAIANALKEKIPVGLSRNPFESPLREVTGIWQDEGFWMRMRVDTLDQDPSGFADIWDWKVTSDVSADAITRKIIDYGYHIQAAHYLDGLNKLAPEYQGRTSFILGFVESEEPFAVRRVCITEGFLSLGRTQLARAKREWKAALSSNIWPDHSAETLKLDAPSWYSMRVLEAAV